MTLSRYERALIVAQADASALQYIDAAWPEQERKRDARRERWAREQWAGKVSEGIIRPTVGGTLSEAFAQEVFVDAVRKCCESWAKQFGGTHV